MKTGEGKMITGKKTVLKKRRAIARRTTLSRSPCAALNKDLIDELEYYVARMVPVDTVCDLIGVDGSAFDVWMLRGKQYAKKLSEGKSIQEKDDICYQLYIRVRAAQGRWKTKVIERSLLPDEAKPSWVRDMTILERRDPKNWRRRDQLEVSEGETFDPDESFL